VYRWSSLEEAWVYPASQYEAQRDEADPGDGVGAERRFPELRLTGLEISSTLLSCSANDLDDTIVNGMECNSIARGNEGCDGYGYEGIR
jgi:hypothetical protein